MMPNGYTGEILRVNLSNESISVDKPDDNFYRRYVGGAGFVGYFLLKELKPGIDPLGPDNKLIFAPGPVTGTPLPGNGRNCVGAKSPHRSFAPQVVSISMELESEEKERNKEAIRFV